MPEETNTTQPAPTQTPPNTGASVDHSKSLFLTIRNAKKELVNEEVKYVSSINERGKFDILPLHENFISLIQQYITIYKLNGEKQTMEIQNGVMHVNKNEVHCYIDLLTATTNPAPSPTPPTTQVSPK
jgi:hypothetical protein